MDILIEVLLEIYMELLVGQEKDMTKTRRLFPWSRWSWELSCIRSTIDFSGALML